MIIQLLLIYLDLIILMDECIQLGLRILLVMPFVDMFALFVRAREVLGLLSGHLPQMLALCDLLEAIIEYVMHHIPLNL